MPGLGPGPRDEGRGTRDEGRGTRDEGRGTRDEGRGTKCEITGGGRARSPRQLERRGPLKGACLVFCAGGPSGGAPANR
ncbi:MAG TPA: hypothetical protein ENK18_03110 [Deltaproteobacteria bacterium]|nr:hypothetical protein [Deltaproteobacteria bacterium]